MHVYTDATPVVLCYTSLLYDYNPASYYILATNIPISISVIIVYLLAFRKAQKLGGLCELRWHDSRVHRVRRSDEFNK